ncbi:MAG: hypothetical protein IT461_11605 [Planctomycetes bacterium]|jgi:hypothetical protein|nr:hypothetical protein [Planctomycetota bacterium]
MFKERTRCLLKATIPLLLFVVLAGAVSLGVSRLIPDKGADYYPGITIGSVTLLLGQKKSQIIGYTHRKGQPSEVRREWHENGQLARDNIAFDAGGHQTSFLQDEPDGAGPSAVPTASFESSRQKLAFPRELDRIYDQSGRLVLEWEYRKGVTARATWYWPETGRVRTSRGMDDLTQNGEEQAWDQSGRLVFHGRFDHGKLIEVLSGDISAPARPPE